MYSDLESACTVAMWLTVGHNIHVSAKFYNSCRMERWTVTDDMVNAAKTEYVVQSAGADGASKREPLKKTGLATQVSAFLEAHCPGIQVSPVVALQNMITWGQFKPDALFVYSIGNSLSATKMIMYDPLNACDATMVCCKRLQHQLQAMLERINNARVENTLT